VSALMGVVTLTFDLLTLKLVCESHQTWGTVIPNFGTIGLSVLELFAMYATDGRTDGQTDRQKQRLLPPSLRAGAQQHECSIDQRTCTSSVPSC